MFSKNSRDSITCSHCNKIKSFKHFILQYLNNNMHIVYTIDDKKGFLVYMSSVNTRNAHDNLTDARGTPNKGGFFILFFFCSTCVHCSYTKRQQTQDCGIWWATRKSSINFLRSSFLFLFPPFVLYIVMYKISVLQS